MQSSLVFLLPLIVIPLFILFELKRRSKTKPISWVETRWFRYAYALLLFATSVLLFAMALRPTNVFFAVFDALLGVFTLWICYLVVNRKDQIFKNSP